MAREKLFAVRIDSDIYELYSRLCNKHAATVSSMTRKLVEDWTNDELCSILDDICVLELTSAELKDALPEVYDNLLAMLSGFAADPDNMVTDENVAMFESGKYIIELLFGEDGVAYTAGKDTQEINNQPPWAHDTWNDFLAAASKKWLLKIIE
ncbi:hypothetical protein [Mahella australiensis]|uniref:Uncharacterized protein n=1 Tax=Mahella australiensis (strain DSM 15567 / CIP 107919 / 50-1 BON) TaxID=697281 RepID=F3ZXE9_MAHA5|nr:hypothetical protein [Mahella australiensis]AEE97630.1 hypothetical protein Mahau_2472 [Mahella australiensis 50-1 BON]